MKDRNQITEEIYHVFTKSIAGFKIFNNISEFSRMIETIRYYQNEKPAIKFSRFDILKKRNAQSESQTPRITNSEKLVDIIAYCLMPTHLHLLLHQLKENGISVFMNNVLNSYSRYFNIKHNRKGPLWECRFKRVLVETDEQLLHLTRYVHLNPVTAYLVNKPEEWKASSYQDYLSNPSLENRICKYNNILDIDSRSYKEFVEERISYQRGLAKIKDLLFD